MMQRKCYPSGWLILTTVMIVTLISLHTGLASTFEFWQEKEKKVYGRLDLMMNEVNQSDNLPRPKTLRSQNDLMAALKQAGRFRELGLSDDEGVKLVDAVYARLQDRPNNPDVSRTLPDTLPALPYPPAGYHAGQEFGPLSGVLLRWPFDWLSQQNAWAQMVKAFSLGGVVPIIYVNTESQKTNAIQYLESMGIDSSPVQWIIEPTNSVWIRDYGPQFIYAGDGATWGIVDFHYYNSRSQDDQIPLKLAYAAHVPWINRQFIQRVYTEGGNLNHDGLGCVIYSQRTYQNNRLPPETVDERIRSAFGAHLSIVPREPTLDATGHVDMFMKIVSTDQVLVARYQPDQTDYQILEDCASLLAVSVNGSGNPWQVTRIPQPDVYYVSFILPVVRTYTNSLIANSVVILPVYGISLDSEAVAVYQQLFPDKTIVSIDASDIIEAAGAWHCVAMEFPAP
jgi:agmatine deiminase